MSNSATISVWKRLWKDPLSLMGMVIIALAIFTSVGGAYLRPDATQHANSQDLRIARSRPGATFQYFKSQIESEQNASSGLFFGGLVPSHEMVLCDSINLRDDSFLNIYWEGEVQMSILSIQLSQEIATSGFERFKSNHLITKRFLLGTDSFGRDMLSRLMAGTLVSLSVGFISVLISLCIGLLLGAIAGYYGGRIDALIMWFINVIWSIPTLLMVIAITLVMGKGFVQVFIAVGLTMWVEVARIVRGQFLAMRDLPYVEAAQSMGFGVPRIITRHLLPNAIGPVIVISAANFAAAILIEAGLSFLGIGTQIPMPSWGGMIKEHYAYITTDQAYLAVLPGICITLLVLSFMLIGNRLRDVLDVKA